MTGDGRGRRSRPEGSVASEVTVGWRTRAAILAALGVACQALMFPPWGVSWLAWVAPLPIFLAALAAPTATRAAAVGWMIGTGVVLAVVAPWLWPTLRPLVAAGPLPRAALLLVVVQVVGALPNAALAAIVRATATASPTVRVLLLPSAWTGIEYLRAHVPLGTPWALLGGALADTRPVTQVADLGGVYAVSFVAVLPAAAIAVALTARRQRATPSAGGALAGVPGALAIATALLAAALLYGVWRRADVLASIAAAPRARIALVHTNFPSAARVSVDDARTRLARHLALSPAADGALDLVVWPENAIPALLAENPQMVAAIGGHGGGTPYLVGAPRMVAAQAQATLRASAMLVDGAGIRAIYDKRQLLPVVETAPSEWLRGVASLGFTPGDGPPVLSVGDLTIAPLVCYEAIFPTLARTAVRAGAELLVNLTNDAWLPAMGAEQHFLFARLRAVETRRTLVRAANRGITAVIDADGTTRQMSDGTVPGAVLADVPRLPGLTAYARFGDAFAWICIVYTAATLLGGGRARSSNPR